MIKENDGEILHAPDVLCLQQKTVFIWESPSLRGSVYVVQQNCIDRKKKKTLPLFP